eukprot:Skav217327  [mRNA]  locus=scaffold2460:48810:49331:- [translate_table: standard]
MRFGAEVVLELAAAGGCAFVEHPQFPTWALEHNPASYWSWPQMFTLRRFECIDVISFDQCALGTPMKKPTTLMLCRLRSFAHAVQGCGHAGRCHHPPGAHVALGGRDEAGDFRTAIAKVYPAKLNQLLSQAIREFILDRYGDVAVPDLFPPELEVFRVGTFMDHHVVQPDFHG